MRNLLRFHPEQTAFAFAAAMCAGAVSAATGPSTMTEPYLVPVADGVEITTILTVGDEIGGYRMVGVPDGLGAFDSGNGSITVLMNHELSGTRGIPRAHGALAAFVSQWSIDPSTLAVNSGADMIAAPGDIYTWQGPDGEWAGGATVFNRLCSADLPAVTAFHTDGEGYDGLIFMNGEEAADEGRAFAWFATGDAAGEAWELPALGKMAWENSIASPYPQKLTLVMGMDDDGREDSQLYMYLGAKKSAAEFPDATPVQLAGLHGGELYGLRVVGTGGIQNETREEAFGGPNGVGNGRFLMLKLGDVTNKTGAQIEDQSEAMRVSGFRRLEDGHWDPEDPRKFYFTTTDDNLSDGGTSRLWRLTFRNIERPDKGGRIELLLDGTEGYDMLDNMTVAPTNGKIYLQEDPGGDPRLAAVWEYDPSTDELKKLAEFDPEMFSEQAPTQPGFLTENEESSGIIDVTDLVACPQDKVCLLLDAQVHTSAGDDELVEPGQLLLMSVPSS
jgi:hypothetical protein